VTSGSLAGTDAFAGALTRTAGEAVGPYGILQGTLSLNSNYNLTYVGANLSIGQRAITVFFHGFLGRQLQGIVKKVVDFRSILVIEFH